MTAPCDITERELCSTAEYFTADELFAAYKAAELRRIKVSYQTAITTPLLRQGLEAQARATRKEQEQQQHGKPAPIQRAHQIDNPSPTGGE